jgi:hypothetical protein
MRTDPGCDLSVIIPFTDAEESVGALSRRAAAHLDALGARYEILAVDEGSGDNSLALLTLVRERLPSLRVLGARAGEGFAAGARVARGSLVWLWDAQHASAPVAPFAWAHGRVAGGHGDLVIIPGRYAVCRRTATWRALERARGRGRAYERQLARHAERRRLRVDTPPSAPAPRRSWFPALLRLRA